MATQDLSGTIKYVSGFTTKSYTINASDITGIAGVQKAIYGNTVTSVSSKTCTINTPDLFSVVNGCGVYAIDGGISSSSSLFMLPVVASIYNLSHFNMNEACDAWLVFPGYSIQVFDTLGYATTPTTIISNILTNTYNKPVIFTATQDTFYPFSVKVFKKGLNGSGNNDIYPMNVVSSIRVWFQNKEIFITGISDINAPD